MLGGVNDQLQTLAALTHGGEIVWCLPGRRLTELQSRAKEKGSCSCLKLNIGHTACRPFLPISFPGLPDSIYFSMKTQCNYATSRRVAGSISDEVIGFFNRPNPSNLTMALGNRLLKVGMQGLVLWPTFIHTYMALGSNQPLTEMSTRNLPRGKRWPARKADNFSATCESIV
jgi:hypothetical protein